MRKVLIVDDSLEDWELIRRAFAKAALNCFIFEVDQVSSAMQYLEGVGAFSDREVYPMPDLILCDVNMPRQGGFDLLDFVNKGRFPNLKIGLMSSSLSEDVKRRAFEKGACACILKGDIVWDLHAFVRAVEDCFKPNLATAKC